VRRALLIGHLLLLHACMRRGHAQPACLVG
jgi:hypothetical protein